MKYFLPFGCLLGLLAVVTGAFGAHGLKTILDPQALANWETAAKYQMYHALALALLGGLGPALRRCCPHAFAVAGWCFIAGILIFSGSLYLLAYSGIKWLGAITPIGGLLLIAGWLSFAIAAWPGRAGVSSGHSN